MTGGTVWIAVALGLGVVVVRRRSASIALVTAQTLLIAIGAFVLTPHRSLEFFIASFALLARAVGIGVFLLWSMRRTREPRPVRAGIAPLARFFVAGAAALAATWLVPSFGLRSRASEQATVALVVLGIAIVASRRTTLHQALGILVAENGIALAATAVRGGLPIIIELGAVFDLILIVAVATAFHERIFGELGTGDTSLLRGLRD